jgi:hypothetical protein
MTRRSSGSLRTRLRFGARSKLALEKFTNGRPDDPAEVEEGSSLAFPHPPGKMFVMTIELNRFYEIREPGPYKLDISRLDDSKSTVHSKPVTLNIVP